MTLLTDSMHFDPALSAAVFLGPSLDRDSAERELRANYYPPVRMGDVYRLVGSGVKLIAIIDGVFHQTTPVWQREIVAAMRQGITVVGASSMGALRAAELEPFGMIGRGRVFELFRSGELDGDDEVALLHGDAGAGYRPLSIPLVNLRHDLARAVGAGLIAPGRAEALLAETKRRHFRDRQLAALRRADSLREMAEAERELLMRFLAEEGEDLKRLDAREALAYCAALLSGREEVPDRPPRRADAAPSTFPGLEALARGLWRADGRLVEADTALARLSEEDVAHRVPDLHARFFLERFLEETGTSPPAGVAERALVDWIGAGDDLAPRLRGVGLTRRELEESLARRAALEWLLGVEPESLGVDFGPHRRCAAALAGWLARRGPDAPGAAELLREAAESAFAVAWARSRGIGGPDPDEVDAFVTGWEARVGVDSRAALLAELELPEPDYLHVFGERAFFHWLIGRGPAHFGWTTWSLPVALLRELQLEERLAPLLEPPAEQRA